MKDSSPGPSSLLHDFTAQQHANVFLRAFSFATIQLPRADGDEDELADRVLLVDDIGFIFQLKEREPKVASKAGDLEKWVANNVVKKGAKQVQNTRDLLRTYLGLSLVNHFGHRVSLAPREPGELVCVVIYRVPPKSRAFRAARFKKARSGGFVHILRDADYFEICQHFVTPAALLDYFAFRRDVLINWDEAATAVSEGALIGQYLQEDYSSPPDARFERAAKSRGGPTACEFSFVMDSLAGRIAAQAGENADSDCYEILTELAVLGRYELKALMQQLRLALEAVRANRLELPFRIASSRTGCGFLIVSITREFQDRGMGALQSLALASKHELDLPRQVGIGMWQDTEFVDIEWIVLEGDNPPDPELDQRLANNYPFRRSSEQRLPPIFV
ncbi:MAG TPA: hypothetical protein VD771_05540 [Gemmatimonadaceae bacterium]|nr:hypothetical protein [Gemmatimonadaceae bacterium]